MGETPNRKARKFAAKLSRLYTWQHYCKKSTDNAGLIPGKNLTEVCPTAIDRSVRWKKSPNAVEWHEEEKENVSKWDCRPEVVRRALNVAGGLLFGDFDWRCLA